MFRAGGVGNGNFGRTVFFPVIFLKGKQNGDAYMSIFEMSESDCG